MRAAVELLEPCCRFTSAITLEMTYGHKVDSDDDAFLHTADQVTAVVTKIAKAAVLELFPSGMPSVG